VRPFRISPALKSCSSEATQALAPPLLLFVVLFGDRLCALGYVNQRKPRAYARDAEKPFPPLFNGPNNTRCSSALHRLRQPQRCRFDIVKNETRYLGSVASSPRGRPPRNSLHARRYLRRHWGFLQPRFELAGEKYTRREQSLFELRRRIPTAAGVISWPALPTVMGAR